MSKNSKGCKSLKVRGKQTSGEQKESAGVEAETAEQQRCKTLARKNAECYVIVLYGPPGSGKTGLENKIRNDFPGAQKVSSGNISREEAMKETKKGQTFKKCVESGKLAPYHHIAPLVEKEFKKATEKSHLIVFDGYPRTPKQLRHFDIMTQNCRIVKVIMDVSQEEIAKRISGRGQCTVCNIEAVNGQTHCPQCGNPFQRRADDDIATWLGRYNDYIYNTKPVANICYAHLNISYHSKVSYAELRKRIKKFE